MSSSESLKLLLFSHDNSFFSEHLLYLKGKYDLQFASNEAMALFMIKEWEPNLCIIDLSSPFTSLLKTLRATSGFLGAVGIQKAENLKQEENAFQHGISYVLSSQSHIKKIMMRLNHLKSSFPLQLLPTGSMDFSSNENLSTFDNLEIHLKDSIVKEKGQIINLTPTQFKLLKIFINNPNKLFSRETLMSDVWNNSKISPRSIDAHISKLKKMLPSLDSHLTNIYGQGYILITQQKDVA